MQTASAAELLDALQPLADEGAPAGAITTYCAPCGWYPALPHCWST
jgi:hypothetical protein